MQRTLLARLLDVLTIGLGAGAYAGLAVLLWAFAGHTCATVFTGRAQTGTTWVAGFSIAATTTCLLRRWPLRLPASRLITNVSLAPFAATVALLGTIMVALLVSVGR